MASPPRRYVIEIAIQTTKPRFHGSPPSRHTADRLTGTSISLGSGELPHRVCKDIHDVGRLQGWTAATAGRRLKVLVRLGALVVPTEADRRIIGATAPYHVAIVQCLFIDPPASLS